ncbi:MAG: alcohol dehydrogenase, partial [Acidimicrobiaceae bacterium]|nr:alcohol dehydrogenase [Acidimicrobiaceae bacterium]
AAYLEGRLPVDKLITKRIALENIQVGLDALVAGEQGRVIIANE